MGWYLDYIEALTKDELKFEPTEKGWAIAVSPISGSNFKLIVISFENKKVCQFMQQFNSGEED